MGGFSKTVFTMPSLFGVTVMGELIQRVFPPRGASARVKRTVAGAARGVPSLSFISPSKKIFHRCEDEEGESFCDVTDGVIDGESRANCERKSLLLEKRKRIITIRAVATLPAIRRPLI